MEEHTHLLHLYFLFYDDVIKWKHVPRHWLFMQGIHRWLRVIHRSPVNCPHTDQWRETLMFSLLFAWINGWVNNQDAGDLRRHRAHYDVYVMWRRIVIKWSGHPWDHFGVQRVTLVQFWIGETGQIGGFRALCKEWPQIWHTALPWLPFLEINYILHSAAV